MGIEKGEVEIAPVPIEHAIYIKLQAFFSTDLRTAVPSRHAWD